MAYDPDTKAEIIRRALTLVDDGASLRQACEEIEVPRKTVEDWIDADDSLSAQYLRARARRAEKLFEEALTIQDEVPERVIQLGSEGEGGTSRLDPAWVAWQNHRVNLRMRMIAKMDPKRYGDKTQLEHSGKIETTPAVDLDKLSDAELASLQAILEKGSPVAPSES